MLDIKILTAYPETFPGILEHSLIGKAFKENITLKEAAIKLKLVNEKEFDRIVDPKKMI